MTRIVVNCRKVPFDSALGVAHVLLNLCVELAKQHELMFIVRDVAATDSGPAGQTIRSIASQVLEVGPAESLDDDVRHTSIELLPHHFQSPEFCDRSIMMCFDLHVFDVPWKYGDQAKRLQDLFRRNALAASAVMTVFPRTYYAVERTTGITIRNLFLTESPLLFAVPQEPVEPAAPASAVPLLLYPAQLQLHKNHEGLARGVAKLRRRGSDVKIICPGSELNAGTTDQIRSVIEELKVEDAFDFVGRVSDDTLADLYRRCDEVIVPSLAEGGVYVPLEAIAFGKPVAVNEIDSARMHLNSMHGHVIWFDASDPDQAADAMQALADTDPHDWFLKNTNCRERIAAATWHSVASKWDAVIGMVQGVRPRPIVAIDCRASEIVYS